MTRPGTERPHGPCPDCGVVNGHSISCREPGRVGVPRRGERTCPDCDGNGQLSTYTGQFPTGYPPCDTCAATGVVPQEAAT